MNVLFLTNLPTLKACNSPYMEDYFKRFSVLRSSEVIFSFLIRMSMLKAIDFGLFLLCFTNPSQFLQQTDINIEESVEIFRKLSMKTVQGHLIIGTT